MRESERSERIPEFYFFDYTAEKYIKNGSHPLWGGAREPKEEASGWLSVAKDHTLASSFGEGGAGGRSASEMALDER